MNSLNEYELSMPVNVWEKVIYNNEQFVLDIYYNEKGFPKELHNEFGSEEVNKFRKFLIDKIRKINNCNKVFRAAADAFAVVHNSNNSDSFEIEHKGYRYNILKKTIKIGFDKE